MRKAGVRLVSVVAVLLVASLAGSGRIGTINSSTDTGL